MNPASLRRSLLALAAVSLAGLGPACQSAYYGTMEAFGKHKRDLLADRVDQAREEQEEAKEQFASALDELLSLVNLEDSDLREAYERSSDALERSESEARDVSEQIASIEDVAEDLFDEWNEELDQYSDPELRRRSERQLRDTRARYNEMIDAMKRAEARMEPVLSAFRDQVLFLKHNLNAQAVASLRGNVGDLEAQIDRLIRDMEASIQEAERFVAQMEQPAP